MSHDLAPIGGPDSGLLIVTKKDIENLKIQRELLREFVQSQLREGIFNDYGKIPGTQRDCLFKPGAEKLLRLFGLGIRIRQADKEIDREANFAIFTYRAEAYHLKSGIVISECEGSANSQEIKYKSRKVWREVGRDPNGKPIKEQIEEVTPVCDVLNTLMKMAQKRAFVGACIMATGAGDFFTQDMDEEIEARNQKEKESKKRSGTTEEETLYDNTPPVCCGKPMMLSKFPDKETGQIPWFCLKCKAKAPRAMKTSEPKEPEKKPPTDQGLSETQKMARDLAAQGI